ncbi:hypothetical protein VKT23_013624 [Stygiomarasmius scandens]|uniref:Uncharacterized protein n=1 Tax=Marasmiellus scandens TaxID=2682957 RepID=A0ABR1J6P9_9AGAR
MLLVGSDGQVWSAGANSLGQFIQDLQQDSVPEHAVKVSAGITLSSILTESGKIFSFGSAKKGQLGNGSIGKRITTGNQTAFDIVYEPQYIKELNFLLRTEFGIQKRGKEDIKDGRKKVKMIGQQRSVALDEDDIVHLWGYNGCCRLGL